VQLSLRDHPLHLPGEVVPESWTGC
jgi:hypothetical protein